MPRALYKYTTASTALAILQSGEVRYSSPLAFNDPFDTQTGLRLDYDLQRLRERARRRLEQVQRTSPKRQKSTTAAASPLDHVVAASESSPGVTGKDSKESVDAALDRGIRELVEAHSRYSNYWLRDFAPRLRIFCVSEDRDNMLMWSHYSEVHRGAVLEFQARSGDTRCLARARPMKYVDHPVAFFSENELVEVLADVKWPDLRQLLTRFMYTKSRHWAYEKEWRDIRMGDDAGGIEGVGFEPSQLRAVYIGCRADDDFRKKLLAVASARFPETRVLIAKMGSNYNLEYTDA